MTCRGTRARCRCRHDPGHDGPHECLCRGRWDDDGWIHAWPQLIHGGPRDGEQIDYATLYPGREFPPLPFFDPWW